MEASSKRCLVRDLLAWFVIANSELRECLRIDILDRLQRSMRKDVNYMSKELCLVTEIKLSARILR